MRNTIAAIIGIILAFIAGLSLLYLQNFNGLDALGALFSYSLIGAVALRTMLRRMAPLLLTGLSASIGFSGGCVNLGQVGQLIIAAIAVAVAGQYITLPPLLTVPLLIMIAAIAGGLWALLAAWFKTRFNMDELISTLMLNFVAELFALYLAAHPLSDPNAALPKTLPIQESAYIGSLGIVPGTLLIALLFFAALVIFRQYMKIGYECRLMGLNSRFTAYGGCRNKRNFILVMFISGALAGIAGAFLVMGPGMQHRFLKGLGANYAWDGVMIAIVAANSLPATFLYSAFFATLQTGGLGMDLESGVPSEFILVFQAIIVLFVVSSREIIVRIFNKRAYNRQLKAIHNEKEHMMEVDKKGEKI